LGRSPNKMSTEQVERGPILPGYRRQVLARGARTAEGRGVGAEPQ
jgi:hypothetical protein